MADASDSEFPIDVVVDPTQAAAGIRETDRLLSGLPETKTVKIRVETEQFGPTAPDRASTADSVRAGEGNEDFLSNQLSRQQALFGQIRGPMIDYNDNVVALNGLLQRGSITYGEYQQKFASLTSEFQSGAQGTSAASSQLSSVVSGLKNELIGLAAAYASVQGVEAVIHGTIELSDEYTNLQNRVRQVTGSEAQLNDVTEQLFKISDETRTSVEENAAVFQRTSAALDQYGFSTRTSIGITKELDEIIISSGSSTQMASRALIEFSEALGRGKLQGQEMRSLLKEVPAITADIAKGLGLTKKQFEELAAAGKATPDVIVKGLQAVSNEVDAKLNKTIPTASSVMTVLHNDLEQFVGQVLGSTGPALLGLEGDFKEMLASLKPLAIGVVNFTKELAAPAIQDVAAFVKSDVEAFVHLQESVAALTPAVQVLNGSLADYAEGLVTPLKGIQGITQAQDELFNSTEQLAASARDTLEANLKAFAQEKENSDVRDFYAQREAKLNASRIQDAEHLARVWEKGGAITVEQLQDFTVAQVDGTEAIKSHEKELDSLLAKITPTAQANAKFGQTVNDLVELFQQGRISVDDMKAAIDDFASSNAAALDPIGNMIQTVGQEVQALRANGEQNVQLRKEIELTAQAKKIKGNLDAKDIETIHELSESYATAYEDHQKDTKAHNDGAAATKKHAQELATLLDKVSPAAKALAELAKTERDLDELVAKGAIDSGTATRALVSFRNAHEALVDPIGHVEKALEAEREEILLTDREREKAVKLREIENGITAQGTLLTEDQVGWLNALVDAYEDEIHVHDDINKALQEQIDKGSVVSTAFEVRKKTIEEHNAALKAAKKSLHDLAEEYDDFEQRAAKAGDEVAKKDLYVKSLFKGLTSDLADFSSVVNTSFSDTFNNAEEALIKFATKGKGEFQTWGAAIKSEMASITETLLADMTKILLRFIILETIGAISPGSSFGKEAQLLNKTIGLATGGDVEVSGRGGTDNNLALLRVSNGETISVRTPEQRRAAAEHAGGVVVPEVHVHNVNVTSEQSILNVMRSPAGAQITINHIRLNPNAAASFATR